MDLIRKMSSGLRSSQELGAAVEQSKMEQSKMEQSKMEQSKKDDSVLPSAGSSDKDDGDVFEDAAPGQQTPRNSGAGADEVQRGGSSGNEQQQDASAGGSGIRAPVQLNDEYDAYDDDDDDAAGEEEEEDEDVDEEDGGGSYGSGESYDSALERMAGSSDANYDTSSSPRISSPVGSFLPGPAVVGGEQGSVMNVSQQGALMRLNQLRAGESSLDSSVIDNSTPEEFNSIVTQLAEKEGKTVEDPSFGSILDALLPLVTERAEGRAEKAEGNNNDESTLKNDNEGNAEVSSRGGDSEIQGSQGSMPRAELSANDEEDDLISENDEEDDLTSKMKVDADGTQPAFEENGVKEKDSLQAPIKAPPSKDDDKHDAQTSENTQEKSKDEEGKEEAKDATAPPVARQAEEEEPDEDAGGGEDVPANREDGDENEIDDDYEVDEDEEDYEGEGDEDEGDAEDEAAALEALVNAVDSAAAVAESEPTPRGGSAGPSLPARPTRPVRSSLPSLDPAPRAAVSSRGVGGVATQPVDGGSQANGGEPADGNEETREKLQAIRVKFLRLALRLGQPSHNVVVAQVLYRLGLAEQLRGGRGSSRNASFSFDRASAIAEDQEAAGPEELDFSCTIMMLGKTGVGKSATINSIFDEAKTGTNAYSPSTKKVQVITGQVHGIKVRVIDTPGLLPSVQDQRHNEKIMASVKSFIKKQSPDIVLYFDRLDMQSRDLGDLPLLRTITDTFGAAVWFNAIVVLTHASSAPPDGSNGLPLSYEMFVAQRSHVVQQTIRQAAGDMRLMNPVSLVENHAACRVNRSRERVLPNGQVWKPQLLLLCFASKILAEANSLLKLQDNTPGRPFGSRSRVPPLPFLLSSLLQSRAQLKLPDEQMGDEDESDEDLESESDSDADEDYDQLPPFRRLSREEVAELDEDNRGNYFEELAERERLFQKKQWREELRRRREMKRRMAEAPMDQSQFADEALEEDIARSAAVPVPMPDMVLPPSFDSDNPSHRYRYLETANQWLVRPVLETHGWDHDNGYDGMSVEKMFVLRQSIPASVSGQITKDKKEASLNMECAASLKHGEGKVTLAGLDLQTVGKDIGYTVRSETRFSNFKGNKTTGGLAVTLLGDTVSAGMKIEDRLIVGKRVKLVLNGGAITGGGDVAYGGSLEATLRDKEYPLSRTLSTLGVSIMDWHGDLAIGGNLQSQFILGRTMMVGRANLNNRGAGQISIRASSSDQMQMTIIGLLPVIRSIANRLLGSQPQQ